MHDIAPVALDPALPLERAVDTSKLDSIAREIDPVGTLHETAHRSTPAHSEGERLVGATRRERDGAEYQGEIPVGPRLKGPSPFKSPLQSELTRRRSLRFDRATFSVEFDSKVRDRVIVR